MKKIIRDGCRDMENAVGIWDSMVDCNNSLERAEMYRGIVDRSARVVLTADMDYASAHAAANRYGRICIKFRPGCCFAYSFLH